MTRYLEIELAIRHEDVRPSIESWNVISFGEQTPETDMVGGQEQVAVFIKEQAVEQYENQ